MFTWICPQCGREVPPSYNDCPDCAARAAAAAQPPQAAPAPPQYQPPPPPQYQPPPPPPQYQPPPSPTRSFVPEPSSVAPPSPTRSFIPEAAPAAPPQYQPPPSQYPPQQYQQQPYQQQPQYAPQQTYYATPPPRTGLPTWLMSILFAIGFGVVVLGAYYLVNSKKESAAAAADSAPEAEKAAAAPKNNPLWKQIEVVGVRLTQNRAKKTEAHFVVVNHSGGEVQDVSATVNLLARTKKDEEPVGSFSFKLPSLGAYESKEMSALVNTKLKVYELPDWQLLQSQLEITQ